VTGCGIPEGLEEADQGQCCTGNSERRDVQVDTLGAAEMQEWHKGPRPETASVTGKRGEC
jgi:hypothetical protein